MGNVTVSREGRSVDKYPALTLPTFYERTDTMPYLPRHAALVGLDSCTMRTGTDKEQHAILVNSGLASFCGHTHSPWGEPCYGCSRYIGKRRGFNQRTIRNLLTRVIGHA